MLLPAAAYSAVDPVAQALMPSEPFINKGGQRMSPEQVAMLRQQGARNAQADFSPVSHWSQGLGRALGNLEGGLQSKRAEKMGQENAAADADMAAILAQGGVDDASIAQILMDPNAGDGIKQYAGLEYQRRNTAQKPIAPSPIEKLMIARGIERGSPEWNANLDAALTNETDPWMTFQGPGMGYTGRQSGLAAAMGGGGQTSGAGQTGSPPAEAVAALQNGEGTAEQFDEMFGAGAAARAMGGGGSNVTSSFLTGL